MGVSIFGNRPSLVLSVKWKRVIDRIGSGQKRRLPEWGTNQKTML